MFVVVFEVFLWVGVGESEGCGSSTHATCSAPVRPLPGPRAHFRALFFMFRFRFVLPTVPVAGYGGFGDCRECARGSSEGPYVVREIANVALD